MTVQWFNDYKMIIKIGEWIFKKTFLNTFPNNRFWNLNTIQLES